jgi:glycosyltransferase involved in cell wall biosynthesis
MLISMPWGQTPLNALSESDPRDIPLITRTVIPPIQLTQVPELFIQISVPNEFQPQGKYSIGITAGIETTVAPVEWLEGLNRMDLNLTISEHSKNVFENTSFERRDKLGNNQQTIKLEKPIKVLPNCIDTDIFKFLKETELERTVVEELSEIPEEFCFLFVGHWLKGNIGEDRKNVGLLIKTFCETFKGMNEKKRPALILKTSGATFSVMDQTEIINKIKKIKNEIADSPNVYLLHGDLTDKEMNSLYNHPKVKAMVSLMKGEGFGRPLLEFTQSNKPVIASGWSGHLDFLDSKNALLVGGELKNVDHSAVQPGVILAESKWFNIDVNSARNTLMYVFRNYLRTLDGAYHLSKKNREKFSYTSVRDLTKKIFDENIPKFATPVPIKLPTLKKMQPENV